MILRFLRASSSLCSYSRMSFPFPLGFDTEKSKLPTSTEIRSLEFIMIVIQVSMIPHKSWN